MTATRTCALLLTLLLALPACERAPEDGHVPPDTRATTHSDPDLYPVEIEPGTAIAVQRIDSRQYMVYGHTDRTASIRVTVEDGHNVLFGPAEVEVHDQRFRIDFRIEPTDRDHVFLYMEDAAGERLAVVPVDTARERTTAGPAATLEAPPELGVTSPGDRRTRVTPEGLESPHVRVRWPAVQEGDRAIRLHGETDLTMLRIEVRRQNRLLVVQQPRVPGPPNTWNAFATELVIPAGLREGDAIVIAPAAEPSTMELIFQPIRN